MGQSCGQVGSGLGGHGMHISGSTADPPPPKKKTVFQSRKEKKRTICISSLRLERYDHSVEQNGGGLQKKGNFKPTESIRNGNRASLDGGSGESDKDGGDGQESGGLVEDHFVFDSVVLWCEWIR